MVKLHHITNLSVYGLFYMSQSQSFTKRLRRGVALWVFIGLFFAPGAYANDDTRVLKEPVSYAEIGEQLMSAHGLVIHNNQRVDEYGVPVLSQQEKRKILFSALADQEKNQAIPGHEPIYEATRSIIRDLELFYTQGSDNHARTLFSQIDNTSTVFGEAVLAKMLARPTSDLHVLQERRQLIQRLVEDEELFDEVAKLLEKTKKTESALLSFWQVEDATKKTLLKGFYFNNLFTNRFNKSAAALELLARSNNFWNICWPTFSDIVYNAIPHMADQAIRYAVMQRHNGLPEASIPYLVWFKFVGTALKTAFDGNYNPFAIAEKVRFYNSQEGKDYLGVLWKPELVDIAAPKMALMHKLSYPTIVFSYWVKWQALKSVRHNYDIFEATMLQMQSKLMGVASFVKSVKKIEAFFNEHDELAQGLSTYANKEVLYDDETEEGKEFKELLGLLKTATFKGKPSIASYAGRILLAHRLVKKHTTKFVGLMEMVGELDACLSVAKLIKKFSNKRVHFSLVEYKEQTTPYLAMNNVWNPMVNPDVVVPNNVELGAQGKARNMILTGSNTGGKSTLLKGMLFSVLLAHTLCISATDSMIVTPYLYIGSSLNIVDNTADGKSLYQAEVDRAASLMKAADLYQGVGFSLLLIDELFRGTGPERAEIETYQCAKQLASFDQTNLILATHYKRFVTGLEEETHGICKNYKIEVTVNDSGQMIHTYKLEEGISTSNVATTILQRALGSE